MSELSAELDEWLRRNRLSGPQSIAEQNQRARDRELDRQRKRFRARRHDVIEYAGAIWSHSPSDFTGAADKPGDREKLFAAVKQLQDWCAITLTELGRKP